MQLLLTIARAIDATNILVGKTVGWLLLVAVIISSGNAIIRKAFDTSSNAWLEVQWYLFGAVFMLAAAYTLQRNDHVRIDVLAGKLQKRTRDWIDLLGHIFFLLPFALMMTYLAVPFFWRSFTSGEISSNAGGLIIWPAKGAILLGFVLLTFQAFSEIIKRSAIIRGELEDTAGGGHGSAAPADETKEGNHA
ncbi:TRAP transporter small permease subunit [Rhizobium sp. CRIBSB]|nr:TRAP transporter small permease subunit [Rhizobium sp. CRIBSB]